MNKKQQSTQSIDPGNIPFFSIIIGLVLYVPLRGFCDFPHDVDLIIMSKKRLYFDGRREAIYKACEHIFKNESQDNKDAQLQYLLDMEVQNGQRFQRNLHLAAIIQLGADQNKQGRVGTALEYALKIKDEHLITVLLQKGARCSEQKLFTAEKGSILQAFVDHRTDISLLRDEKGRTLLHYAMGCHWDIASVLVCKEQLISPFMATVQYKDTKTGKTKQECWSPLHVLAYWSADYCNNSMINIDCDTILYQ